MSGFFKREEVGAGHQLPRLTGCGACRLYKQCKSPKMEPTGKGEQGILIIAEAPGPTEDSKGVMGDAGKFLSKKLQQYGINLDRDCRKTNSIICRPVDSDGDNRPPTSLEIECCRPNVWKEINRFKPRLILLLGHSAVNSFLGHRWRKDLGTITKWRGWAIPDRETNAWVVPMFHPNYILREEDKNPAIAHVFNKDLKLAVSLLHKPFPMFANEMNSVQIVDNQKELCQKLNGILEWKERIAFDYETTGLKPYRKGHKIVSCAICMDEITSFAFDMPGPGKALSLFRQIMIDPDVPKIAQNLKFEDNWTNVIVKCPVEGWEWDTMIATHLLDNREGITGLKFQSYVRFGLLDYSSHIEPFLVGSDEKDSNSFNRILQAPRKELLIYNGIDALLEFKLAMIQMDEMGYDKYSKGDSVPF